MKDDVPLIAGIGAVLFVLVLAFLMIAAPARGHSWYPPECCGGNDCEPIAETRVRVVPGGYLIDGKHFVETARARVSQDGDYHACWHPTPDNLWCFFRPSMGS